MGENNRNKSIILLIGLALILAVGVFLIFNKNGKKTVEERHLDVELIDEGYHYIEELAGECTWESNGFDKLSRYDGKIVRANGWFLQDMRSKEDIYKMPDIQYRGYLYINEEEIWDTAYDRDNKKIIANCFDNKGKQRESIELKGFKGIIVDDSYIMIDHMIVGDEYIYLTAKTHTQPTLHIFTKTGELRYTYENVKGFDVDNKGNCVFTTVGSEAMPQGFYMIGSEKGTEIFRNTSYTLSSIRFSEDGDFIYGFDGKINAFSAQSGEFKEKIFEFGRDSTYLLDDYDLQDFWVDGDGYIYYSLRTKIGHNPDIKLSEIKSGYYLYRKQKGSLTGKEVTLTITAPYRIDFMDEAIKRYELKYPMEHVEYDYTYNTYDKFRENSEEYGNKLALDIITGEIGDIVHTGGAGIEVHNIFASDAFMDLTNLIEDDKNYKDLNVNVLNGIRINNAIRALPLNYIFSQCQLNEELEEELGLDIDFNNISWSEVFDLVKIIEEKAPDRHLFTRDTPDDAWYFFGDYLLINNMPDLINLKTKEVDLNQKWFTDLLVKFKEYSKSKNFVQQRKVFSTSDRLQGSLLHLSSIREQFYGDALLNFEKYNKTNSSRMIPIFTGEKNDNRFGSSIRMYSINNRSDRKEEAWKFLSFLLGEDIQFIISRERSGLPLNKKGVERMIGDATYRHNLSGYNVDRYNNATIENSHKIDYLYEMGYLRIDILNSIALYMNDKISLDEALKMAEESVIIRLNE